ncbi:MAG: UDP-N-acetylmuramoyl-tripeptide--D-alanyl-D-alanine ligase [Caldimonas sp.]
MMTLAHAQALLPSARLVGDPELQIERVHSDTRSVRPGDLFVALKGERFDAHDFLAQAKASGAVAVLAERGIAEAGLAGLEVADSQRALLELAGAWRRRFDLPLIAVAGSNGKTTVTQMIASMLRAWLGAGAFATEGNYNNHIGVPLTLLRLRQDDATWHRAGVVELGMNHPGEIALLAALVAPNVALVNNAQREHQEFMAGVEAVARENGAAIGALGPTGVAVFPADDAHAPLWHELAHGRPTLTFALHGDADVGASAEWHADHWRIALRTPAGRTTAFLAVAGLHNVKNALAATACALAAGCPLDSVVRGLAMFMPVQGRSQTRVLARRAGNVTLIDDSYNANPDSVRAAIDVLAALPGPRWLVLGDMGEVGARGIEFHVEVGSYAQQRGIDAFWSAGPLSTHAAAAFAGARHFSDVAGLLAKLPEAPECAAILVKGSRFMKMEQVVSALLSESGAAHAA